MRITIVFLIVISLLIPFAAQAHFLEDEAGISAYVNLGQTINLNQAKLAFVGLEKETQDYILGSLRPSLYTEAENEEVHCFVHKEGWILTYYTKDEPRAKIFDRRTYYQDLLKLITMLQNGIDKVCKQIGATAQGVNYYDFKYPNANRLMLVVDGKWEKGWEIMYLTIPTTITVYETSWSHSSWHAYSGSKFKLDDIECSSLDGSTSMWQKWCSKFSPSLSLGIRHKIELWEDNYYTDGAAFIALAIVYSETP